MCLTCCSATSSSQQQSELQESPAQVSLGSSGICILRKSIARRRENGSWLLHPSAAPDSTSAEPERCFPVGEGAGRVCSLCIPEHKLGSEAGDFSFHNKENLYFRHWQRITESKEESVERARGCHGRECLNKLLVTVMINPNF